ncbi:MAG: anthranilate synthase component 1 [Deltaproteobacteria bacterium]
MQSPLSAFAALTGYGSTKRTLLLETADVDSKQDTQSLLMLGAHLELRCTGRIVSMTAVTDSGKAILAHTLTKLDASVRSQLDASGSHLELEFPKIPVDLEEEQRLKSLTPFQVLRHLLDDLAENTDDQDALCVGGVFGYDMLATFENLPDVTSGVNPCPDMVFYLAETLLVIDHAERTTSLQTTAFVGPTAPQDWATANHLFTRYERSIRTLTPKLEVTGKPVPDAPLAVDISDEEFSGRVNRLKGHIDIGDIFQVVLSRCFSLPCADTFVAYQQLKSLNPSPYMFYVNDPDFVLFGASPESALRYESNTRKATVCPIAGTRKRGKKPNGDLDTEYDARIELELRTDEKELSEHLMLVDLARNDLAKISAAGTRHVEQLLKVDRYSHVMHLVSKVAGTLRDDLDALHAYQACMNMGTLVGAPKIKAAELIRQVEGTRRGSYGGAVGYINGRGDLDSCIVIRSACVVDGVAHIQAGAGIVLDSDPIAEANETRSKANAVITAVLKANLIVTEKSMAAEAIPVTQ